MKPCRRPDVGSSSIKMKSMPSWARRHHKVRFHNYRLQAHPLPNLAVVGLSDPVFHWGRGMELDKFVPKTIEQVILTGEQKLGTTIGGCNCDAQLFSSGRVVDI